MPRVKSQSTKPTESSQSSQSLKSTKPLKTSQSSQPRKPLQPYFESEDYINNLADDLFNCINEGEKRNISSKMLMDSILFYNLILSNRLLVCKKHNEYYTIFCKCRTFGKKKEKCENCNCKNEKEDIKCHFEIRITPKGAEVKHWKHDLDINTEKMHWKDRSNHFPVGLVVLRPIRAVDLLKQQTSF